MAQGQFTKEEAAAVDEAFAEVMKAFPKKKLAEFIGHFNDIALFLAAAKNAALTEEEVAQRPMVRR